MPSQNSYPTIDSARLETPYDSLTTALAADDYAGAAHEVCTRLFLAEVCGSAPLSQREIAEKTRPNVRTIRTVLSELEDDGYVVHHDNPADPRENLYRLVSLDVAIEP